MDATAAPAAARRWPKRLLIIVALLAAVLGAAYAALVNAFPPKRLAELLAQQAQARTGRATRIDGGVSFQLLPRIGVVLRDVSVGNARWGTEAHLLRVQRAELHVELLPLLQRQIDIERVVLQGVDVRLETDRQGLGNWVMTDGAAPGPKAADPDAPLRVDLSRLQIDDATLRFRNGRDGTVRDLALKSLSLRPNGDSAEWEAQFSLGQQSWALAGQTGSLAALAANRSDWPFDLQLEHPGARLLWQGKLLPGSAPRAARGHVAASINNADVLAPWLDAPVPLPLELRTDLHYTSEAVKLSALTLSLAGQELSGRLTVTQGTPSKVDATLSSPSIDIGQLMPKGNAKAAPAPAGKKLFDAKPIPFDLLTRQPVTVVLSIDQLRVPGLPPVSALKLKFDAAAQRAQFEPLSFAVAGGTVRGSLSTQVGPSSAPRVKLQLTADNLSMETLARAAGAGDYVRSGNLQLRTDLSMAGSSSAALAASATGELLASAKDLKTGNGFAPIGPNLLPRVLKAVRLQPAAAGSTLVECVVVRLPLRNGVAEVDRSIALQTPELTLVAKGHIDLRDETLQLALRPNARKALGINTAQLASLVMLKGPLLDPGFSLDVEGAAGTALTIGAAVASGGLSMLGQNLMRQSADPQPCQTAATGKAPAAAPSGGERPPPSTAKPSISAPELLQKLFKR